MLERLYPALLLIASNVFMTFAWYGHLRYKSAPLALAIASCARAKCSCARSR